VSNEVYLREDRGGWLEEIIQSSSSSDSQKAIEVDYSQHYASIGKGARLMAIG